ncbi:hypothetical protein [Lacipirellula sp.]|uniref:hypothetical protein n=1 Tax=Lacipirellula sp. TaxID=2691419 RepID=UPI003D0FC9D3
MKTSFLRYTLFAAGIVSALAGRALAVPNVYFDRDDTTASVTSFPNSQAKFNQFTAALGSFGVDTIETSVGINPTLSFGATGITAASQNVLAQAAPGFTINTQALLELDAVGFPQGNTIFTFNQYVNGFGAFVIQGGDGASSNPTTFRLRDTATNLFVDVPVQVGPSWGLQNVFFLGVIDSTPFNEVQIIETLDSADGMLYDNIVVGTVPEPSALALASIVGVAITAARRRFRS